MHAQIAAVWRLESAKLIGALTRLGHDLAAAEDCAQEALRCRSGALAHRGPAAKPGRLADDHRQAQAARPPAPRANGGARAGRPGAGPGCARGRAQPRPAGPAAAGGGRRARRRRAQAALHRLPPVARPRGAMGADAAPGLRPHRGRDRPRHLHQGGHGGAAHQPRQGPARRPGLRAAGAAGARPAPGQCADRALPDVQRGLRRQQRCRSGCARRSATRH